MLELLITSAISPGIVFILATILLIYVPERFQPAVSLTIPVLTLYYIWQIPTDPTIDHTTTLMGAELHTLSVHAYSHIFATIFCIAAFAGTIFALNQYKKHEILAALLYAGSAIGVTFSGDLLTLFLFWEMMALGSTMVIWSNYHNEKALSSGMRYAVVHFLGGVIFLTGIAGYYAATGSLAISQFDAPLKPLEYLTQTEIASWLMLIGILINAAAPPLSTWLPDAYPESSVTGMVFLSAFTTKTAVFVLLTLFAATQVLIYIGLFMIFYGIIYAILENDMRKILAYSIVNQVGFMVVGIGIGTELSLNGAAAHAFCHIIYKALLLMSAGSVLYMTGKRKCSELGGLYHTMKVTMVCGIIGALAISSFPFTSGFISKSMISSAAHVPELEFVWYLLLAASAGVFLHAGIKFPWFVFFQKDSGLRPEDPPKNMQLAMILLAALCIIPGFFPQTVYFMLPTPISYDAYADGHVITQLQLLLFSGLAFFLMLPMLKRTLTISLDFDWFYRKPLKHLIQLISHFLFFLRDLTCYVSLYSIFRTTSHVKNLHSSEGVMARNWPIGTTVLWIGIMLGLYLVSYLI